MWPLRKRRTKTNGSKIPPEVEKYYKAAHRERMGMAWLIAFLTLIVTVAIVLLLFLGARWVYRKTVKSSPKAPATVQPTSTHEPAAPQPQPTTKSTSTAPPNPTQPTAASPQPGAQNPNLLRTGPEGDD